jgi:hypothetical protein
MTNSKQGREEAQDLGGGRFVYFLPIINKP